MPEEQKQKLDNEPVESPGCNGEAEKQQEQEKDFKTYLSHDGLFGFSFDKKNVAESFVKENLPAEITNDLDFSTLTPDKDTFIDQKLSRCYSDVLYRIEFRNKPAYLYFLFEHKSWEPEFPGVQLLKNMVRIWETHVEHHKGSKKLPPIIPILIYHGKSPWKTDTNFTSMFDISDSLIKYIPAFSFELSDVSHMPEEKIKGDVELRIVLTAFRYIFHPEVMSRLKDIFQLFGELPNKDKFNQYLEALLIYLGSNIKDVKPEELRNAVNNALEEGGMMMSTVFQQVLQQGKEIGVKEGKILGVKEGKEIGVKEGEEIGIKEGEEKKSLRVALNCLIKGIDVQTIAEITDLPVERIEILKIAVQNNKD